MGGGASTLAHGGGRRSGWPPPVRWAVGLECGRNPCRFFGSGAVTLRVPPFIPGGCRVISIPASLRVPGETLGQVWAAVSSSSHSFLEVLLGVRRFGALGCGCLSGGCTGGV